MAVLVLAGFLVLPLASGSVMCKAQHRHMYVIHAAALLAQMLISSFNAFVGTLIGGDADAQTFHRTATYNLQLGIWQPEIGAGLYTLLLQLLYAPFGSSQLLGQALTIATSCLGFVYLCKIVIELDLKRSLVLLLLAALLPSKLLLFSMTLRDVFEMTFFVIGFYYGLRWRRSLSNEALVAMLAAMLLAGVWHHAYLVFMLLSALLIILWPRASGGRTRPRATPLNAALMVCLLLVAAVALPLAMTQLSQAPGGHTIARLLAGDTGELVISARELRGFLSAAGARTDYGADNGIVLQLVYYLLKPFPWEVRAFSDAVAGLEAMLRLALLLCAGACLLSSSGERRNLLLLMLALYLASALFWSMGTTNYGNAARHQLTHFWLLCLVGGPRLQAVLEDLLPRPAGNGRRSPPALVSRRQRNGDR